MLSTSIELKGGLMNTSWFPRITTWSWRPLASLKPDIRTGALIYGIAANYAAFASDLKAYSANLSNEFIPPAFIEDAKKRGLKVFVHTVNDQSEISKIREIGVDGIFTDYPDIARSYWNS
jgi:glycerophosphoryl diester phosphodiesterase